MKAVVYTEYGPPDVLHLTELEKPSPRDNEILIRIYATPVNYGDIIARNFANIPSREFNMPLREKLQSKGYTIVGEFICPGHNTNKFLKTFGGLNKGRLNAQDLKRAEEFAQKLKQNVRREM